MITFQNNERSDYKSFNASQLTIFYPHYELHLYQFISYLRYDTFNTNIIQRYYLRAQNYTSVIEREIKAWGYHNTSKIICLDKVSNEANSLQGRFVLPIEEPLTNKEQ